MSVSTTHSDILSSLLMIVTNGELVKENIETIQQHIAEHEAAITASRQAKDDADKRFQEANDLEDSFEGQKQEIARQLAVLEETKKSVQDQYDRLEQDKQEHQKSRKDLDDTLSQHQENVSEFNAREQAFERMVSERTDALVKAEESTKGFYEEAKKQYDDACTVKTDLDTKMASLKAIVSE